MEKKLGLFYNQNALQHVLMGVIDDADWHKQKDVGGHVVLYDRANQLVGFNVINADKIIPTLQPGFVYPHDFMLRKIENLLGIELGSFYRQPTFVIGEVLEFEKIPGTHLRKCLINVGNPKPLNILCGANNFQKNVGVVVALEGSVMPDGKIIKKRKIHGDFYSEGMLCSYTELGLPHNDEEDHGIICLPLDETQNKIGSNFTKMYSC